MVIGNKLWSALIARSLASLGYLIIVPDYRNFPQGTIEDMCEDLISALKWTLGIAGITAGIGITLY